MSPGSTEPNGLEIARQYRFLLWRLPLLAATLVLTAQTAPFWAWWAALAIPLVAGTLSVYLFRPRPLQRWCSRGWLMGADAVLIALALYGAASTRPLILAGFSAVVLLSVLIGGIGWALFIAIGAIYYKVTGHAPEVRFDVFRR